jgi:hypothetical protein
MSHEQFFLRCVAVAVAPLISVAIAVVRWTHGGALLPVVRLGLGRVDFQPLGPLHCMRHSTGVMSSPVPLVLRVI